MPVLALEEFASAVVPEPAARSDAPESTAANTAAAAGFEQGYQAGWDDAVAAQSRDQTRIGADFARSLQELSFTFHEARAQVTRTIEPLLRQMVETILPGIAADALGALISSELQPVVDACGDARIELVIAPADRPAMENHLAGIETFAIRLAEEPSLASGQAYLRVGKTEIQFDVAGAVQRIGAAIRGLHELNERTLKHA